MYQKPFPDILFFVRLQDEFLQGTDHAGSLGLRGFDIQRKPGIFSSLECIYAKNTNPGTILLELWEILHQAFNTTRSKEAYNIVISCYNILHVIADNLIKYRCRI